MWPPNLKKGWRICWRKRVLDRKFRFPLEFDTEGAFILVPLTSADSIQSAEYIDKISELKADQLNAIIFIS